MASRWSRRMAKGSAGLGGREEVDGGCACDEGGGSGGWFSLCVLEQGTEQLEEY